MEQLRDAVEAVFRSWTADRAVGYRRLEGLTDLAGTAVTVQAMVFGNRGDVRFRCRVHAGPSDRREPPLRRLPAQRPGGRHRRRSSGDGRSRGCRRGRPGWPTSSRRCAAASRPSSATRRTSSSPSRTASCGCCKPAGQAHPSGQRCRSRAISSTKGCSTRTLRSRRLLRSTLNRSPACDSNRLPLPIRRSCHSRECRGRGRSEYALETTKHSRSRKGVNQ